MTVGAKIFERIIYDRLNKYLKDSKLLSNHQSGFRTILTTFIALLEVNDSWSLNIDHGNINAVVYLDLRKTSDHTLPLSKLDCYGIAGPERDWFRS